MADLLIKHLETKSQTHSDLSNLWHQWGFDEKLIPKALQNIVKLFPHYSRHDESHSKQILINIERLLGPENITLLTASDTWLILESAYLHDIGMVVPQYDIEETWSDKNFISYVSSVSEDKNNELSQFCSELLVQLNHEKPKPYKTSYSALESSEKFLYLLAEWFRKKHPERSNIISKAPRDSIGLSSPRTELIPQRLFRLLGRICESHGDSFENIVGEKGLPYKESGLANEDCHPRFVACLLRMGDLLDMDDNRFCPTMMKMAGDNRPALTKAHEAKHAGLTHLRIDRDRIEIQTDCEDIDAYIESCNWTDWIKEEIQSQMSRWSDIVPSREFGLLPTLGTCKVNLSGNYSILDDGKRPEFNINKEKAISLFQGENLYEDKFSCIRELMQNSIDASLIRFWLENRNVVKENNEYPTSTEFEKTIGNYPININFKRSSSEAGQEGSTRWLLTIEDRGTGISRNDLSYMLQIAGSSNNKERREIINSMPEWIKPSGHFGIGLQSLFMLTDSVKIITKSIFDHNYLEVIMYNPNGSNKGLVLIKDMGLDINKSYGTTLEIEFELEDSPDYVSYSSNEKNVINIFENYDHQLDTELPIEAARIVDKIHTFSLNSQIPIYSTSIINKDTIQRRSLKPSEKNMEFMKVNGQTILFDYDFSRSEFGSLRYSAYRGQEFECSDGNTPFFDPKIDILSGDAGSWLNFNRDKVNKASRKKLFKLIDDALYLKVKDEIENEKTFSNNEKFYLSIGLKYNSMYNKTENQDWMALHKTIGDLWLNVLIGKNFSAREILNRNQWTMYTDHTEGSVHETDAVEPAPDVDVTRSRNNYSECMFMCDHWFKEHKGFVSHTYTPNKNGTEFLVSTFSKKSNSIYSTDTLSKAITDIIINRNSNRRMRYTLEVEDAFFPELHLSGNNYYNTSSIFPFSSPNTSKIILPYSFRNNGYELPDAMIKEFCKWIQPKLINQLTTQEVENHYRNLILYVDETVMKDIKGWVKMN